MDGFTSSKASCVLVDINLGDGLSGIAVSAPIGLGSRAKFGAIDVSMEDVRIAIVPSPVFRFDPILTETRRPLLRRARQWQRGALAARQNALWFPEPEVHQTSCRGVRQAPKEAKR